MHREFYDDHWKNLENGKNVDVLHMIANNVAIVFFLMLNSSFINTVLTEIIDPLPQGIKKFLGKIKFFLLYSRILPDADLFFDPVGTTPFNNFYLPRVTLIHDIIYNDLPRYMYTAKYAKKSVEAAARHSDTIISVSKFSQRRIREVLDIDEAKVYFVHTAFAKRLKKPLAVDHKAILRKYGLKKNKYIVYPSCFWQHKNHSRLLQAFAKYLKQYNSDMKLVLMRSFTEKIAFVYDLHDLADHVVTTDYVDNDTFRVILENASAIIQASLYEGVGMTVLEGMDAGKPVTASRVASVPEIAGDAVLYFDPYDIDDMCSAIHRITSDEDLREYLVEKGREQVEKFSNKEKMTEEYIKILESVMQ
jgi:glycosyltransferase involved in cell wall biosynthesis